MSKRSSSFHNLQSLFQFIGLILAMLLPVSCTTGDLTQNYGTEDQDSINPADNDTANEEVNDNQQVYNDVSSINSDSLEESNDVEPVQSVIISGRTATVDGVALSGAWVAIANDATQQLVSETSSDQNGTFTIKLNRDHTQYMVLAIDLLNPK